MVSGVACRIFLRRLVRLSFAVRSLCRCHEGTDGAVDAWCEITLGSSSAYGRGKAGVMTGKQILWAIAWFLVLIFLAWPIGFFCAGWYVCLCPFEACIDGMKSITALLMKGVSLPFGVAHRMVKGKSYSSI
ncbi:unnamed protein product [Porites lobata]|uniref:Uncharacterized protein n=1 Tax=Porites lobata TaxID=104759 RepID=A0ABN8MYB4_9CNID|nr:unnamed protein product [Porites lobata]